jgi:hypothetical protein
LAAQGALDKAAKDAAQTILRVANGGTIDPEKLKEAALESVFADPLKLRP